MTYQVRAGLLNQSIILENPGAPTPDGDGGFTEEWTALSPSPVWASVLPATPALMERATAATVQAATTHLVEMRYHPQVSVKTRIRFGTRFLQVTGVQNVDEADEVTRLSCVEKTS